MATTVGVTLPRLSAAAASDFTVARLRAAVKSSLSDADLQVLLDDAMHAIEEVIGRPGARTDQVTVHGDLLPLARRASSITSVIEDSRHAGITLAADDYELSDSGRILMRLRTGTHPAWTWRGRVKVRYVPVEDSALRIRTAIALVKLSINHTPGLAAQAIGAWSEQYGQNSAWNYEEERRQLLAGLEDGGLVR